MGRPARQTVPLDMAARITGQTEAAFLARQPKETRRRYEKKRLVPAEALVGDLLAWYLKQADDYAKELYEAGRQHGRTEVRRELLKFIGSPEIPPANLPHTPPLGDVKGAAGEK